MLAPVRFAVVGIGHITRKSVLPAFTHTQHAVCTALISGQPDKLAEFSQYRGYLYDQYDQAVRSGEFDAVYLALPNHLHREYATRALEAGLHVLCEKPLAVTAADAQSMCAAAERHNVRLMVAYRNRFSAAHRQAVESAQRGDLGELRSFHSVFLLNVRPHTQRTAPRAQGGGTLPDIGVYCLNSVRQFFGDEMVDMSCSLLTRPDDERFRDCEEMCHVTLTFPGQRLATFTCGFGASRVMTYTVAGTKGSLHLDPVYEYASDIEYVELIDGQRRKVTYPRQDQFALEIDHLARAIQTGEPHEADGREGALDTRIIEDLYGSAIRLR